MLLCAWFFDSHPALFLAVFMAVFLVCRAVAFLGEAGATGATVSLQREVKPELLRQGGMVTVITTVHFQVPPGMTARISDLPPPGAPVIQGMEFLPGMEPGIHAIKLKYVISCLSSGNIRWRGLDLRISDPFFSFTLPFRDDGFRQPVLRVDPAGRYQKRE